MNGERLTWQIGIKLVNDETLWLPGTRVLTRDQAKDAVAVVANGGNGMPVPTHHLTEGEHAFYFVPAAQIRYHVIKEVRS